MKNCFLKILCISALFTIIATNTAFAADYVELAPIPGNCKDVTTDGVTKCVVQIGGAANTLGKYINNLYKTAVAGASVLAVLMILVGGFNYVSSDAIGNKESGKETIKAALGGMLLIFASWVILNTINPQLVSLKIVSKPLKSWSLNKQLNRMLITDPGNGDKIGTAFQNMKKYADSTAQRDADAMANSMYAEAVVSEYNELKELQKLQNKNKIPNGLTNEEINRMEDLTDIYGDADFTTDEGKDYLDDVEEIMIKQVNDNNADDPNVNTGEEAAQALKLAAKKNQFHIGINGAQRGFKIYLQGALGTVREIPQGAADSVSGVKAQQVLNLARQTKDSANTAITKINAYMRDYSVWDDSSQSMGGAALKKIADIKKEMNEALSRIFCQYPITQRSCENLKFTGI